MGKASYVPFVDLEKAFDVDKQNKMLDILNQQGLTFKDMRIILNSYEEKAAVVNIDEEYEEGNIKNGVR